VIARLVALAAADSQVDDHLTELVEDIGPRLTGSHALLRAETWARDRFRDFGLEASLERWGEVPVGFDRGPWSGSVVAPKRQSLEFVTMAWTPGALGPVRGAAVLEPSTVVEARRNAARLRGAWVLQPPLAPDAKPMPAATRTALDLELRKAGIAGFVARSRDPGGELVHTTGKHEITWQALPADVRVHLQGKQFDEILAWIGAGQAVELEFSIDNRFFNGPVIQSNVVADLKGSERPDECVIVGGHLDSWDGARGAVDNGTGVATTLEAARLLALAGARPKRTIRFMLWGGEEQGLLGSKAWVAAHPQELPKISAVLVHDGGTNYLAGLHVTPEMLDDMKRVVEPATRLSAERPFALFLTDALQTGGSDHTPFAQAGVPAFFWVQEGRADYDHAHHTQHDVLDAAIDEYQRHSALVVAMTAWNLANLPGLLDRTDAAPIEPRRLGADLDGVTVKEVSPDGAAKKGGLRAGDTIRAVDGKAVATRRELVVAVRQGGPRPVLRVDRGGREVTVTLDFTQDPAQAERDRRTAGRKARFGELKFGEVVYGAKPPAAVPPAQGALPPSPATPAASSAGATAPGA
jgi:hypothetical protein